MDELNQMTDRLGRGMIRALKTLRASGHGPNESAYKTWLSKDQHSSLDVGLAKGNLQSGSSGMGTGNYGWNLDKPAQGLKGVGPC